MHAMGNFTQCSEREKVRREKLADYLYDVSKLVIGGMVIGVIVTSNDYSLLQRGITAAFGLLTSYLFANIANRILK